MRYVFGFLFIIVLAAGMTLLGLRLAAILREAGLMPKPVPQEGRLVETELGSIYVEELGPETGPVLLLVHGSVGWSRMWRPTQEALAAEGYRAIAFDMPPMGWSFRDPGKDYSRQTQAARLIALTKALGVKPTLVAHSFGAGPAAEAAMLEPAAFSGLVVVSGAIGLGSHLTEKTIPWPMGYQSVREYAVAATVTNPLAMRPLLKLFLHRKAAATDDVVDMLNSPGSRPGTTAAIADWVPSLLVPPVGAQSTRPDAWKAFALPLAFIWGDRDTATPLDQAEELARLTGAPLTVLQEVGHIPQIEAPTDFQAALIFALSGL